MRTKTQAMADVFSGRAREAFTFVPDDGTAERHYDISALRDLISKSKVVVPLLTVYTWDVAPHLRETRAWDPERVRALTEEQCEEPGIALVEPDGKGGLTHIIADGTHRIIRREADGREFISLYEVAEKDAPRVGAGWGRLPGMEWGESLESVTERVKASK